MVATKQQRLGPMLAVETARAPNSPAEPFEPPAVALRRVIQRERDEATRVEYSGPSNTHSSGWAVWASVVEAA